MLASVIQAFEVSLSEHSSLKSHMILNFHFYWYRGAELSHCSLQEHSGAQRAQRVHLLATCQTDAASYRPIHSSCKYNIIITVLLDS